MTPDADQRERMPTDLHVHTTVSDGRAAPAEVVRRAAQRGVRRMVITDHHVITAGPAIRRQARESGVELPFAGLEVSTVHEGRRHHILVYTPRGFDPELTAWFRTPLTRKNERLLAGLARLRRRWSDIPSDGEVLAGWRAPGEHAHPEKQQLGRSAIVAAVVASCRLPELAVSQALASELAELDAGSPEWTAADRNYLPSTAVLDAARQAGAVCALAHPLWRHAREQSRTDLYADIAAFQLLGLSGMEVASYHHARPGADPQLCRMLAERGLLRFGGSDYHANGKSELGRYGVTDEEFELIRAGVPDADRSAV